MPWPHGAASPRQHIFSMSMHFCDVANVTAYVSHHSITNCAREHTTETYLKELGTL